MYSTQYSAKYFDERIIMNSFYIPYLEFLEFLAPTRSPRSDNVRLFVCSTQSFFHLASSQLVSQSVCQLAMILLEPRILCLVSSFHEVFKVL